MSRSTSVFGLGFVGTVTAACLANRGNNVIGVDLNRIKVEAMDSGNSPIVEPRVSEIITDSHKADRLQATTSAKTAVLNSEISLLCVGTPSLRNGKLDLGHIQPVCREVDKILKKNSFQLVVLRSTVLPWQCGNVVVPTLEKSARPRPGLSAKEHSPGSGSHRSGQSEESAPIPN